MKSLSIKFGIIFIGLLIFGYAEVWGADWKYYTYTLLGDNFYDTKGITLEPNGMVRVWVKIVFSEKGRIEVVTKFGEKFKDATFYIELYELDCKGRKAHSLKSIYYTEEGDLLKSHLEEGDWDLILPDSMGEILYKAVCK